MTPDERKLFAAPAISVVIGPAHLCKTSLIIEVEKFDSQQFDLAYALVNLLDTVRRRAGHLNHIFQLVEDHIQ